ncbi:hypothetical protein PENSPDRAFT_611238 [Peniophora sp. CONT]|nr:hypothetical protein PENSPDRAFT_611238 [Peniophora sp. CONT]
MQGSGVVNHSRNLRRWTLTFIRSGNLPVHRLNMPSSVLQDEDIAGPIRERIALAVKDRKFRAEDVVKIVAGEEIQAIFCAKGILKPTISVRTARRWLNAMGYKYGRKAKGMYFDGHEREDVVAYRDAFVARWKEYEKRFQLFDNDGHELPSPKGFALPNGDMRFRLHLVTHDECIFYQNDKPGREWHKKRQHGAPTQKGEGQTVMVSDFLVPEWGRLVYEEKEIGYKEEARILLRPGKERDGYFAHEDLIRQVDHAIDVFELRTKGRVQALFMFDNAPSHMKRAPDALSARYLVKKPTKDWTLKGCGVRMRDGVMPDGSAQPFYWPENHPTHAGWFKGMEQIIRERGLWPARGKLKSQCDGFKCPPGRTDCCCRRLLFNQPDFVAQKPALQEFIEARGHLCDFYPKYHCELNFIEQYWGAAKLRYRALPRSANLEEMQKKVVECLADVPLISIQRYSNRSARFIDAYAKGLDGAEAIWANRKYHGHRTLPPDMISAVKKSVAEYRSSL